MYKGLGRRRMKAVILPSSSHFRFSFFNTDTPSIPTFWDAVRKGCHRRFMVG